MSYQKAREHFEARRNTATKLTALLDDIGDADPSEEQRSQIDALNKAYDLDEAAEKRWLREGELNEQSDKFDKLIGDQADAGQRDENGMTPIEKEVRALLGTQVGQSFETVSADSSADIPVLARRSIQKRATTDILAGTATDGAELVPTTLFGELYVQLREGATSVLSLARDIVTAGGEALTMPTVSAFSTAAWISEAGAITESTPQFSTVTLNAYKAAAAMQISAEFTQDHAVPGAIPWIMESAGEGLRRFIGDAMVTGNNSAKPNGIVNGSTTTTVTGVTFPTGDNLISAFHDVASPYRRDAVWMFADPTVEGIRKLKFSDGTGATNQYLWQPGLAPGMPDTLLGRPVVTDAGFAAVGANAKIGVFGDIRRGYVMRTVAGVRFERSIEYAFLNDLVTYRVILRTDGEILDNAAFTVLTNEAS